MPAKGYICNIRLIIQTRIYENKGFQNLWSLCFQYNYQYDRTFQVDFF